MRGVLFRCAGALFRSTGHSVAYVEVREGRPNRFPIGANENTPIGRLPDNMLYNPQHMLIGVRGGFLDY